MPSKTGILPGNGKKPQTYDERRAPSVETLAEAARDIRVTSEVFSPRQPGTPTPFAYSKDYRTTPEERRWLMEIEARLGNGSPYLSRLNSRRTEFREAQQNWRDKRQMPWAFISPYRQQYFGRDAFKPAR